MKNQILVSVVMPAFNAEKFIGRAIKSIQKQTFKKFELIIIDDGSNDNTLPIVYKIAKTDKRIRIIPNSHNLKIALSLNKGVSLARSSLIARMDPDDIALPNRLVCQYDYLIKHPDVAIVGADILIINKKEKIISSRTYPTASLDLKKIMFRYSPFAHPAVMFRKKIFQEFGGYNPQRVPCEDIDFWFKVGSKYDFGSIPKPLLKYTLSPSSGSHYNLRRTELMGFQIKLNAIKQYGFKPDSYDIIFNILQYISAWFMGPNVRIHLYNYLRSRKII